MGKILSQLAVQSNSLGKHIDLLLEITKAGSKNELIVKRNSVVYLFQILKKQGRTPEVQENLIHMQLVFQRFLFDRRESV